MNLSRIILLAAPLWLAACSTTPPAPAYMDADGYSKELAQTNPDVVRVVRHEQFKNVLLVKREAGSEANSHPQRLSTGVVSAALRSVQITRGGGVAEDLFDKEASNEINELSGMLVEALALAGPDEDVLFHFPQTQRNALLAENLMLNGRVFVRNQQLHIIFGEMRDYYEGMWLRAKLLRKFKVPSRAAQQLENRTVVATSLVSLGGNGRKDWAVIDLTRVALPAGIEQPHLEAVQPVAQPQASVAERLQKLQQLKERGLISEEEYQAKRRQILDSL